MQVQKGTSIAIACLLALGAGEALWKPAVAQSTQNPTLQVSQTIELTRDQAGVQLTYYPLPNEPLLPAKKGSELLTQALASFEQSFPETVQADRGFLALSIAVNSNEQFSGASKRLVFQVKPFDASGTPSTTPGNVVNAPLNPPPMAEPPPGYPLTPNEVTDVTYRQWRDGYRRDTQYHRTPGRAPDWQPGPWQLVDDHTVYVGGSGSGGGSSGSGSGGGTVIVHPPIIEEEAN